AVSWANAGKAMASAAAAESRNVFGCAMRGSPPLMAARRAASVAQSRFLLAIVRALEFPVKRHREHRCKSGNADVSVMAADPFIPTEICV
ncbi:MAG TPA: hypothetical protein VEP47_18310, partial [Reyranella sp.]|nr:hypothetical protein [Reyranella sp.]